MAAISSLCGRAALGALLCLLAPASGGCAEAFLEPEAAVSRVLDLVNERLSLMPGVAAAKWRNHSAVADPAREARVIGHAVDVAADLGLAPEGIRDLFALQVRLAREHEQALHERWAATGLPSDGAVPDLERDVRPRLDALSADLMRALYLAAPVLEAPAFVDRYGALAAARLTDDAWTPGAREQITAALAALRTVPSDARVRVAKSGVLRVGTTGDYLPYSLEADGALTGADIELAEALARRLGARPVFVRTTWRGLMADLAARRFDLAVGGISVTPERAAVAQFSRPYATGGKTILARCRDAPRYRTLPAVDRPGVRVIVNPGGTNESFVNEHIHRAQVVRYPDNRGVVEEIRAGRADVMITDDVEVELATHRHADLCRTFAGTLTRAQKAILMPRDAEFVAAVNDALAGEIRAGTPARRVLEILRGTATP